MKTTTMRRTVGIGAAAVVAVLITLVMAFAAFAAITGDKVAGIDTSIVKGDNQTNLVVIDGAKGETVYVDIFSAEQEQIALRLESQLDKDSGALYLKDFPPAKAVGYTFDIYAEQKDQTAVYSGKVFPVYAQLGDDSANRQLIGVRTLKDGETRNYYPEESLYVNGKTYVLEHGADGSALIVPGGEGELVFKYKEPASVSATGTITYVDQSTGKTVLTTQYMGIEEGKSLSVKVPAGIVGDDGNTYRTVYYYDAVTLNNPNRLSIIVPVSKRDTPGQISPDYYTTTVKMVADGGKTLIAEDKVTVLGDFNYAVPETVYQKTDSTDPAKMYLEYKLDKDQESYVQNGIIAMKPDASHPESYTVNYTLQDTSKEQQVTYTLIDASQPVTINGESNPDRVVGTVTKTASVTAKEVVPEATVENSKGETLYLAGSIDQYKYTFGSGESPAISVYYMPKGYTPKEYKVTVNYVNLADGTKLNSPDPIVLNTKTKNDKGQYIDTANYQIDFPRSFSQDGEEYVLVNGQTPPIQHNLYSGNTTYTIYYRNVKDNLSADVYINRINVVYNDTVTAQGGTTPLATDAGLNAITTTDGGVITNNAGVDADTVRIGDEATPLAQGNNGFSIQKDWPLVAGGIGIALLGALIIAMVLRKRKETDEAK